jgi:hypothetical protein
MERAKVSIEEIDTALHQEFSRLLGNNASDQMLGVKYRAIEGEPNWDATIGAVLPLPVMRAFNQALALIKSRYDLNETDHARLPRIF